MATTQRFASLVKKFGMPYATTLWTQPTADPDFSKAISHNRVVTIVSENAGSRKDYGKIGYHPGPNANFLIFPKTLPQGDDSRIVGIQYDALAAEPARGKAIKPSRLEGPAPSASKTLVTARPKLEIFRERTKPAPVPARAEKPERRFNAVIRRTAIWKQRLSVTARNHQEARKKFQQAGKEALFAPSGATIRTEIKLIRRNSES